MVKTSKLAISLAVVALLVALGSLSAQADQITFGPSNEAVTFTNTSATTLSITLGTLAGSPLPAGCVTGEDCLEGFAHAGANSGTFAIATSTATLPTVNQGSGSPYAITGGVTSAFTFDETGGSLTGTVSYSYVKDGTSKPNVVGSILINTVSGANLLASYTPGDQAGFDFTVNPLSADTLDVLFGDPMGTTTASTISSGEINTPEPASLCLFGLGLLGLAFVYHRRMKVTA